jgi:hypothetical protein
MVLPRRDRRVVAQRLLRRCPVRADPRLSVPDKPRDERAEEYQRPGEAKLLIRPFDHSTTLVDATQAGTIADPACN